MSFTSYDSIINSLASGNGQDFVYQKSSITTTTASWYTLWTASGNPIAGNNPSGLTGSSCTSSTVGAIGYTNTTGSNTMNLLSFGVGGATQNIITLYDRLWHVGGINLNSATTQTIIGSTAPSRYTGGVGNSFFVEITTAAGSTARNMNISYTNQSGTPGQTATVSIPASAVANTIFYGTLAAGDTGVQSIQSVTMSSTMGSGVANLVLYNQSMFQFVPYQSGTYTERDLVLQLANLPIIQNNACLNFLLFASTTTSGLLFGKIKMAQG